MGRYVRYLHAQPEVGSVDILDGELTVVRNLQFGQVTPYFFAERPEEFIVEVQGNTAIPLMMRQESADMTTYVLTGDKDSPVLVPVEDPMVSVSEDAALRLANFGQRDVELYIGTLPEEMELFLENASPGEVTEYRSIAPGRYFADLRSDEGGTVLARIPILQLRSGVLYSLYVIGTVQDWKVILVIDGASYLPYSQADLENI